jgi:predicted transcriptional regulator
MWQLSTSYIFDAWYQLDTISLMAMTIRLSEELDAKLERLANELGVSKQQAVIHAIELSDAKSIREHQLAEAREFVLSHDAELMEKLADA